LNPALRGGGVDPAVGNGQGRYAVFIGHGSHRIGVAGVAARTQAVSQKIVRRHRYRRTPETARVVKLTVTASGS